MTWNEFIWSLDIAIHARIPGIWSFNHSLWWNIRNTGSYYLNQTCHSIAQSTWKRRHYATLNKLDSMLKDSKRC